MLRAKMWISHLRTPGRQKSQGIPIDISKEELKSELINYNFDVKLVKRDGLVTKPIYMVILNHGGNAKEI